MMALAVAVGVASAVSGYYLAALFDVSVAGMMAVATGALFVIALLFSPSRGLVAVAMRGRRNRSSFSRGLLLSGLDTLGGHATEERLVRRLDWEGDVFSRAFEGFVLRSAGEEVALTRKGRDAARRLAQVTA
jgi:manganese/zinc/iron transport system permease protein